MNKAYTLAVQVKDYQICKYIITEYIMAQRSYSFVCTLHYLIIIIMQKYLKVLNF